jgi:hypothetical protein
MGCQDAGSFDQEVEEELHVQLGMIAKLEGLTLTDALRQAIDHWIDERRNNPELQARAAAVLADIDREAATARVPSKPY